jgi:hypothetical protein
VRLLSYGTRKEELINTLHADTSVVVLYSKESNTTEEFVGF